MFTHLREFRVKDAYERRVQEDETVYFGCTTVYFTGVSFLLTKWMSRDAADWTLNSKRFS